MPKVELIILNNFPDAEKTANRAESVLKGPKGDIEVEIVKQEDVLFHLEASLPDELITELRSELAFSTGLLLYRQRDGSYRGCERSRDPADEI